MTDKMTAEQALEWLVSQAECLAENCGSSFAKIEEARQALTAPRVPDGVTVFPTTLDETDAWHSMSKTGERPVEGCDSVERWNLCNLTSDCIGGGIEIWWKQASIAALRIVVRDDFNRSRAVQVLTGAPAPADDMETQLAAKDWVIGNLELKCKELEGELAAAEARVRELESLIASHNAEMERMCDGKKSCGYDRYKSLDCPQCPKDYQIDGDALLSERDRSEGGV